MAKSRWPAVRALDEILEEDGPIASVLKDLLEKSYLWRLRTGERAPSRNTAVKIHHLTGGRVPMDGWPPTPGVGAVRRRKRKPTPVAKAGHDSAPPPVESGMGIEEPKNGTEH